MSAHVAYRPIDWIEWLPGELYRVGDDGSVWRWYAGSNKSGELGPRWKPAHIIDRGCVRRVSLCHDRQRRRLAVGPLVLRAFVGPRPLGHNAIHFPNRDPQDDRLCNLRWAPKGSENYDSRGGPPLPPLRGENSPNAKLALSDVSEIFRLYQEGWTQSDIACEFDVDRTTIKSVLRGQTWASVGIQPVDGRERCIVTGSRNGRAVLGETEVMDIARMLTSGVSRSEIARQFDVSKHAIRHIARGRTWSHITKDLLPELEDSLTKGGAA